MRWWHAVAVLPMVAAALALQSPGEPTLLTAIREYAVRAGAPNLDAAASRRLQEEGQHLRERLRGECAAWPNTQVAEAFIQLSMYRGHLRKDPMQGMPLLDDLETELARRSGPRDGWSRLLHQRARYAKDSGQFASIVPDWQDLWRSFDGPKRVWLAAAAGRDFINLCDEPAAAEALLTEALGELQAMAPWDEPARAVLVGDADLDITMSWRPSAGSWRDARGRLLLLRGYAREQCGRLLPGIGDLAAAREDFVHTGNLHRLANCDHDLASLWLQLGRFDLAIARAHEALQAYLRGFDQGAPGSNPDGNGVLAMRKLIATAKFRAGDLGAAESELASVVEALLPDGVGETNADALTTYADLLLRLPATPARRETFDRLLARVRAYCGSNREQLAALRCELLAAEAAILRGERAAARAMLSSVEAPLLRARHLALQVRRLALVGRLALDVGAWREALAAYARAADVVVDAVMTEQMWRLDGASTTYVAQFGELLAGMRAVIEIAAKEPGGPATALAEAYRLLQRFHGFEALCRSLDDPVVGAPPMHGEERRLTEAVRRLEADHRRWLTMLWRHPPARQIREAKLAELQRELELQEATLAAFRRSAATPWAEAGALVQGCSLAEVQQALDADELLIECVEVAGDAWAFVVTRDDCRIEPLPKGASWRDALTGLQHWVDRVDSVPGQSDANAIPELQRLAAELLPAGGWLERWLRSGPVRTLLWSPEGSFAAIPLAALPWQGRPLVVTTPVVHVVSGTSVVRQRAPSLRPTRPLRLLALGNPRYPAAVVQSLTVRSLVDGAFPALPAAAEELLHVAQFFARDDEVARLQAESRRPDLAELDAEIRGERFRLLLGDKAKESALDRDALQAADVLHFACHGEASAAVPAMSFLALSLSEYATAGDHDGMLRLGELARLRGDYALVVLSACRSGAGVQRGHDVAAGLAWAAQLAGARRVLASLWRVPDRDAMELVVEFYGSWLRDGLTAAEALAGVQRRAIGNRPVRAWASFGLWGAAR